MHKKLDNKTTGIELLIVLYWVVLVAWQNISNATARTGVDTIIKAALMVTFILYFLVVSKFKLNVNVAIIFFIAVSLLITFILNESISISSILAYFYPIVFMVCIYSLGGGLTINKRQLLIILNSVILVVLYMVIYALIFKTSQFTNALAVKDAYGSELSSFLASNLEYGMYLSVAIISSILCYDLKADKSLKHKWYYIAVIPLFLVNLILTFSRINILGLVVCLVVYCLFGKKSLLKRLIIIGGILSIFAIFNIGVLRNFFFKVVFKDGNLAGRDDLAALAIEKFNSANIFQKLFGYSDSNFREFTRQITDHSSIHNAYLQVLLSYGLIPLISLVVFLIYDVFYCINLCKFNKFIGVLFLSLVLFGVVIMLTSTTILFSSPIDSYFLTLFVVVLPKYVGNAIIKKEFD